MQFLNKDFNCSADVVIAFHAKLRSKIENWKADDKIVFGDVTLNDGNGYNNQTGVFTAPYDGIYVFEWTILTYPGKYFCLDFMVNNKSAAITQNRLSGSSHPGVSSSVVVKLQKDDKTWLESYKSYVGQYAHGDGWTYLSGFKL
ncbi:hypothetical protein FSP39_009402 [Pinctada imbricata]|uniref:C1q domain-containing protein n=1 Tax=Pinctada imbricata TaxID=66713 RepID=A0AA89C5S4_PINIB|nr:hypothetical protein FSP39_009402 [Pinctada imbricata]